MHSLPHSKSALKACALAALAFPTQAQFVRPPPDLQEKMGAAGVRVRFKQVPAGICETRSNIKSFSGFADIGPSQHVHFQFFEARKGDAKKAPLSVWLEGGVGGTATSSLEGLYQSMGPCRIGADGKVMDNPHAWSEAGSNLLFIDESVGIGFSYTEPVSAYVSNDYGDLTTLPSPVCPDYAQGRGCGTYSYPNISLVPRSIEAGAENFYSALQGFMGAFPEYAQGGVNLAGRETGSNFIPTYAKLILERNKEAKRDTQRVELKSIVVGLGGISPALYFKAQRDYMVQNAYGIAGFPNASVLNDISNALEGKDNCLDWLKACDASKGETPVCNRALDYCLALQKSVQDYTGRAYNDTRLLYPDTFVTAHHVDYLNTPAVQAALGACTNFTAFGAVNDYALGLTGSYMRERPWAELIRGLVDAGIAVAMYAGDADATSISHPEVWSRIAAPGHAEAGFVNLTTSDGKIHGQVRQAGLLSFTRFYLAGSPVPFYKPLASLEFFERAINGKDIATGKETVQRGSTYKTVGSLTSDTVHGNATVQYKVLPPGTTYNTDTGMANAPPGDAPKPDVAPKKDGKPSKRSILHRRGARRSVGSYVADTILS